MKRLAALVLASVMLLPSSVFAQNVKSYYFVEPEGVGKLPQSSSQNGDYVKRGEAAEMFSEIMGYYKASENEFYDLNESSEYHDAVLKANRAGIMIGDGQGMRPNDNITFEETAVLLCKSMGLEPDYRETESENISHWAEPYLAALENENIFSSSRFFGGEFVTRTSLKSCISKAFLVYGENGEGRTAIINKPDTTLQGSFSDVIISEGVADGDVYIENAEIKKRLIIRGGGRNSIHINSSDIGEIEACRRDGDLSIVTDSSSNIEKLKVQPQSEDVSLEGFFSCVQIYSENSVELLEGNIDVLEVNADGSIIIGRNATVGVIESPYNSPKIVVEGVVEEMNCPNAVVSGNGVVGQEPQKYVGEVIGEIPNTNSESSNTGGSSNSSGGGSSSDDDDDSSKKRINVTLTNKSNLEIKGYSYTLGGKTYFHELDDKMSFSILSSIKAIRLHTDNSDAGLFLDKNVEKNIIVDENELWNALNAPTLSSDDVSVEYKNGVYKVQSENDIKCGLNSDVFEHINQSWLEQNGLSDYKYAVLKLKVSPPTDIDAKSAEIKYSNEAVSKLLKGGDYDIEGNDVLFKFDDSNNIELYFIFSENDSISEISITWDGFVNNVYKIDLSALTIEKEPDKPDEPDEPDNPDDKPDNGSIEPYYIYPNDQNNLLCHQNGSDIEFSGTIKYSDNYNDDSGYFVAINIFPPDDIKNFDNFIYYMGGEPYIYDWEKMKSPDGDFITIAVNALNIVYDSNGILTEDFLTNEKIQWDEGRVCQYSMTIKSGTVMENYNNADSEDSFIYEPESNNDVDIISDEFTETEADVDTEAEIEVDVETDIDTETNSDIDISNEI